MVDVSFACSCGKLRGHLREVDRKAGSRLICYCKDCQTAAHALGHPEMLTERGGAELYQTTPSHVVIEGGQEHLACLRLSPKGLMRWYADCCNTPLFNTLSHTKLTFAGVLVPNIPEEARAPLGPLTAETFTESATGDGPEIKAHGFAATGFRIIRRHLGARLRGKGDMAPFFDAAGAPTRTPRVLTLEERKAATPGA